MKIVKLAKGLVAGLEEDDHILYKGIPYASPPVGKLRFRPPKEESAWDGVYMADHFPNRSWQTDQEEGSFYEKEFYSQKKYNTPYSEDCLYLNIWVPNSDRKEKYPVALWIHGGSFDHGFGHEMEFDGAEFCKRGVILVTINYRVGIFGFLAHPWLSEENQGRSGNYGILDQIAALKWVYKNIEAFGGDRDRITVFGQSAGSWSVQTLVSSVLTKGMIKGAILQSYGGYKMEKERDVTLEEMEQTGKAILADMEISSPEELRAISEETLWTKWQAVSEKYYRAAGGFPFVPIIDRHVLEAGYNELAEQGRISDIPYMIGSTANDLGQIPEEKNGPGLGFLQSCSVGWSFLQEELGRQPAYVYYFDGPLKGDSAGAFHSGELWYMFGTLDRSWRPKDEEDFRLSKQMLDYWCNFVKTGKPVADQKEWMPCSRKEPYIKELK